MSTPYAIRAYSGWLTRTRNSWRSTMTWAVLAPLMYLAAMGSGLGRLVGDEQPVLGGVDYGVFLAPALLAAAAMHTAIGEATWPVMGGVKWDRCYHAMLATPLRVVDVFYGHLLLIATRIAIASLGFAAVALALGHRPASAWAVLTVPAAVLTGVAFATPVAAWAVGRKTDNAFAVIYRVVAVPLFMFSGTFFPLSSLPDVLAAGLWLTPLAHGVALCRGLTLGTLPVAGMALHAGYLATLLVLGLVWGRRTFAQALAT